MHGFTLVFLGLTLSADPLELPKDVHESHVRRFAVPIDVPSDSRDKIETIRLLVSVDQGETWKYQKDYKLSNKRAIFTAAHDGLYWFAVQSMSRNGGIEPADVDDLVPVMKVYVSSMGRTPKAQKSYEELKREVENFGPPHEWWTPS